MLLRMLVIVINTKTAEGNASAGFIERTSLHVVPCKPGQVWLEKTRKTISTRRAGVWFVAR